MTDYAVKVTIRNGRILRRMRAKGIETAKKLADLSGVAYPTVVNLLAMKIPPMRADGTWRGPVEDIAGVLGCDPEDLFTDTQRAMALKKNTRETFMDEPSVMALAGGDMEEQAWAKLEAQKLLGTLSDRERTVVEGIMGGATLDEMGQELGGISRTMVAHLEKRALRKMKGVVRRADESSRIERLPETVPFTPNPNWKPREQRLAEERESRWQAEQERRRVVLLTYGRGF